MPPTEPGAEQDRAALPASMRRYTLNYGPLPRCAHATAGRTHTEYQGDGAHRWTKGTEVGRCLTSYACMDCPTEMLVDSSD